MIDARIEIRSSHIVGAGNGVFARVSIPAGTFLDYYRGQIVDIDKPGGTPASDKLMTIMKKPSWWPGYIKFSKSAIINAAIEGNWVTIINHGDQPNTDFDESGRFFTISTIKAGDELLVDYGYAYWKYGAILLC